MNEKMNQIQELNGYIEMWEKELKDIRINQEINLFFKNSSRFSDIVNVFKYDGKTVFTYDNVQVCNNPFTSESEECEETKYIGMKRHNIMKYNSEEGSVYIALELQNEVNLWAPYIIMIYENFTRMQQRILELENESYKPLSAVSFIFYYGKDKWADTVAMSDSMRVSDEWKGINFDARYEICDIKNIDITKLKHPDNIAMIDAVQKLYEWDQNLDNLEDIILRKDIAIVVASILENEELKGIIEESTEETINISRLIKEL